jgi:hypothetical protein
MSLAITGGVLAGAGAIGGAVIGADASGKASSQQIAADQKAAAQNRQDQAPFLAAGQSAVQDLSTGSQPGGKFSTPFTMADATNSTAETYAQQQASMASQNSAAARGGLIGSNEQQELQTNAAGIASQYEGQAFNQWLQGRQQQINVDQSLAGEGLQSASNVDSTNTNLAVGAGNAAAAGTIGSANAVSGGASALTSQLTTLSQLFGNSPTTSYTTPNADGSYNNPTGGGGEGIGVNADGSGAGAELGGAATAGDYSDRRLKTNVKRVGKTDSGVPIYSYQMKSGGPFKMGVMADELEKSNPRAVSRDMNSLMMVDYRRVH